MTDGRQHRATSMTALCISGGLCRGFRVAASAFVGYLVSMLVVLIDSCQELQENRIAFKRALQDRPERSGDLLESNAWIFFPEAAWFRRPGCTCRFASKANDA